MQTVIIVVHLMIVLAMIGLVLLQRSEGGGLGMGGGGGGFMTSRGSANVLSRGTAILAGSFFVTSLLLSILAGMDRKPTTLINSGPAAPAGVPQPPTSQGGGLLDQLKGPAPQPAAPAAPSGPQVPQSR